MNAFGVVFTASIFRRRTPHKKEKHPRRAPTNARSASAGRAAGLHSHAQPGRGRGARLILRGAREREQRTSRRGRRALLQPSHSSTQHTHTNTATNKQQAALGRLEAALQPYLGLTLDAALAVGEAAGSEPASTALALASAVSAIVRTAEAGAGRAVDACPALARELSVVDKAVKRQLSEAAAQRRKREAAVVEGEEGGGGDGEGGVHVEAAPRPAGKPHAKKRRAGRRR
jgi:hypothetical protein